MTTTTARSQALRQSLGRPLAQRAPAEIQGPWPIAPGIMLATTRAFTVQSILSNEKGAIDPRVHLATNSLRDLSPIGSTPKSHSPPRFSLRSLPALTRHQRSPDARVSPLVRQRGASSYHRHRASTCCRHSTGQVVPGGVNEFHGVANPPGARAGKTHSDRTSASSSRAAKRYHAMGA